MEEKKTFNVKSSQLFYFGRPTALIWGGGGGNAYSVIAIIDSLTFFLAKYSKALGGNLISYPFIMTVAPWGIFFSKPEDNNALLCLFLKLSGTVCAFCTEAAHSTPNIFNSN